MPALILAATLTCAGSLIVGQAACWACGARTWTFLAVPVGLALLMLVSILAIHVPGHATTVALLLLALCIAGLALLVREPKLRPRFADLLSAVPVFFLVLLPFLVNGRAGTLGVSMDNDMATHLLWAEAIRSPAVAHVTGLDAGYPIGPHALCAVLAQATGIRVDYAFAGETLALPILLAWTTLGAVRRVGWPGRTFVAVMCATTFMVAGYYAQGSFKEIMQALFVLGFALGLQELMPGDPRNPLRWIPLAIIIGGSLSVYSVTGLPWFAAILVLWLAALVARRVLRGASLGALLAGLRSALAPAGIAVCVLLVLVAPQLPRLVRYYKGLAETGIGTGIPTSDLGNLVGPVSFWKVFGMWDEADYRLAAVNTFHVGMFVAFGTILTFLGGLWWLRRGGLAVPLATGVAMAIWIYANRHQSPYLASKALVILAPLVMLLATRWLVELMPGESWFSLVGALRLGVAALLGWAVLGTSVDALRSANVGGTAHTDDLRTIQPLLARAPTLFLGWDDFISWELAGTPVSQPFLGYQQFPLRPQKEWKEGQTFDFDDIPAGVLDKYTYVVSPRDPAGSQPPSNMRLVRTTRYYEVFKREGPTPKRETLREGVEPGAVLDCTTPKGRALAGTHGVAAVRSPNVEVGVLPQPAGSTVSVQLALSPGEWWLSAPYISPHPIEVRAPGLRATLPANLERPGNRWPIGQIAVTSRAPVRVSFHVQDPLLAIPYLSYVNVLIATPQKPIRIVPLSHACGQYVDWYSSG